MPFFFLFSWKQDTTCSCDSVHNNYYQWPQELYEISAQVSERLCPVSSPLTVTAIRCTSNTNHRCLWLPCLDRSSRGLSYYVWETAAKHVRKHNPPLPCGFPFSEKSWSPRPRSEVEFLPLVNTHFTVDGLCDGSKLEMWELGGAESGKCSKAKQNRITGPISGPV